MTIAEKQTNHIELAQFANLLLDTALLLAESGAHSERIHRNIRRLADKSPYRVELFVSFNAVSVSVSDGTCEIYSSTRTVKHHGVHFGIITRTSLLTWKVFDEELSLSELSTALTDVKSTPKHPTWLVAVFVAWACACLCLLAGGDPRNAGMAFVASLIGFTVRQQMLARTYNIMVTFAMSSLITTLVASIDVVCGIGSLPDRTVATSVLFLIPGVPLINGVIDLLKGFVSIGIARGVYSGFLLLSIALGMFVAISIVGYTNF